jgi:hypothetical protein
MRDLLLTRPFDRVDQDLALTRTQLLQTPDDPSHARRPRARLQERVIEKGL